MSHSAPREIWICSDDTGTDVWSCHEGNFHKIGGWYRLRISNKRQVWYGTVNGVEYVVPFADHPGNMQRIARDASVYAVGAAARGVTLEELFAMDGKTI